MTSPIIVGGLDGGNAVTIDCRPIRGLCFATPELRLGSGDLTFLSKGRRLFQGVAADEGSNLVGIYSESSEAELITGNSYLQIGTLVGASGKSIVVTKVDGTYRKEVVFPSWGARVLVGLNGTGDYKVMLKNGDVAVLHDGTDVYSVGEGVAYFERAEARSGLSAGAIAGIVIGAILLVTAGVVIFVLVIRPRFHVLHSPGEQQYEGLNPAPLLGSD
jgi:hypothetical protein